MPTMTMKKTTTKTVRLLVERGGDEIQLVGGGAGAAA